MTFLCVQVVVVPQRGVRTAWACGGARPRAIFEHSGASSFPVRSGMSTSTMAVSVSDLSLSLVLGSFVGFGSSQLSPAYCSEPPREMTSWAAEVYRKSSKPNDFNILYSVGSAAVQSMKSTPCQTWEAAIG